MNRDDLLKLEKSEILDILFLIIDEQIAKIDELTAKVSELEARLNQNSTNSSKPPSSDVFPRAQSPRKSNGKKAGGQKGHKGKGFKITQPSDIVVSHNPVPCAHCAHADACTAPKEIGDRRYEVDIEIKPIITEHQKVRVHCPWADEIITGNFPAGITSTVQYGANLEALAVSLNTLGMVSINRTHEILKGVFGFPISTGTIATMVKNCAHTVSKTVSNLKKVILGETLIHCDETSIKVNKKIRWAHIACTKNITCIFIEGNRGQNGMDAVGILPKYIGTAIHDCWSPYFKYDSIRHGLCGAHLIRELIAVTENTRQEWAEKLMNLILELKATKDELLSQDKYVAPLHVWEEYSRKYDEILREAQAQNPIPEKDPNKKGRPKKGKVRALIDRLVLRKDQWLLFFTDFTVPFTNNQAERDFRVFKLKQKASGSFRTEEGANDFATITSFVSTARKRGISPFVAIRDALLNQPFAVR